MGKIGRIISSSVLKVKGKIGRIISSRTLKRSEEDGCPSEGETESS